MAFLEGQNPISNQSHKQHSSKAQNFPKRHKQHTNKERQKGQSGKAQNFSLVVDS